MYRRYDPELNEGDEGFVPCPDCDSTIGCANTAPSRFVCTLQKNHDGNHVAHGMNMIAEWDDDRSTDFQNLPNKNEVKEQ